MSHNILLVEDDADLSFLIQRNLELEGYHITPALDGQAATDELHRHLPDLVVLDLMLPHRSGLDVLRDLRRQSKDVPVIILTARSGVSDRVLGLKLGADDYVTKPFEMIELLARVEAVLRRTAPDDQPTALTLGDLHINFEHLEARRAGKVVSLSTREFRILQAFAANPGKALSREELMRQAWGENEAVAARTVDAHIKNLRKKVEPDPSQPAFIRTLHREGYMLVEDAGTAEQDATEA